MWFPYGHLIKKVLEHIGFDVKDEESLENAARIGNDVVEQMQIEINYGASSQNPSKVR